MAFPSLADCQGHDQISLKFGSGWEALRGLLGALTPILNLSSLRISTQCHGKDGSSQPTRSSNGAGPAKAEGMGRQMGRSRKEEERGCRGGDAGREYGRFSTPETPVPP